MAQYTSWDGIKTKQLNVKGGYTRYANPYSRNPSNVQVVRHRKKKVNGKIVTINYVYSPSGQLLYTELARHNFFGADKNIPKHVQSNINKALRKQLKRNIQTYQR